jgi:hypothetical protein
MSAGGFIPIVTDGLLLSVDALNKLSYIVGSTGCIDMTNRYPGVLINEPIFDVNAWSFDGVDQEIEIDAGFGISQPPLPITVDCWVYINTFSTGEGICTLDQNGTNYFGVGLNTNSTGGGALSLTIGDGLGAGGANRSSLITSNGDQPLQEWFHCCAIFTSPGPTTDIKCYINSENVGGVYDGVGTGTSIGWSSDVNSRTRLGVSNGFGLGYGDVSISSLKVYGRALSQSEITQNYEAQKYRFI